MFLFTLLRTRLIRCLSNLKRVGLIYLIYTWLFNPLFNKLAVVWAFVWFIILVSFLCGFWWILGAVFIISDRNYVLIIIGHVNSFWQFCTVLICIIVPWANFLILINVITLINIIRNLTGWCDHFLLIFFEYYVIR